MISTERFKEFDQASLLEICQEMNSLLPVHLHQDQNMGSSAQQIKMQLHPIVGSWKATLIQKWSEAHFFF